MQNNKSFDQDESRKIYIKPEIVFEEQLEVVAISCNPPAKNNAGTCPAGPINS